MTAAVAILYQSAPAPAVDGVVKPMKPNGYRDSGADIAWALRQGGRRVVTPVAVPDPARDEDWSFPDSGAGIDAALAAGASVLWANSVLYRGHPLESFLARGIRVVGQEPRAMEHIDDKLATQRALLQAGFPVPAVVAAGQGGVVTLEGLDEAGLQAAGLRLPVIVKPQRGRGSTGVRLIESDGALRDFAAAYLAEGCPFGTRMMIEDFLPGEEATVAVLPPGLYAIGGRQVEKPAHWCLWPVRRFNHQAGIAPYSGTVAVTENSRAMDRDQAASPAVQALLAACAAAGTLLAARAPLRIDARQGADGRYRLFDVNSKPNMTAAGRPGREGQDSLMALAARPVGWDFPALAANLADQAWSL